MLPNTLIPTLLNSLHPTVFRMVPIHDDIPALATSLLCSVLRFWEQPAAVFRTQT
jgi:hypothetical protein